MNTSVYEVDLVPTKLPEHDDPLKILEDYFNTAVRTYIRYLRTQNHNPRDFKYIVEVNNNQDRNRKDKFTVSVVLTQWSKALLKQILNRIEDFIVSANITNLNNLSITVKSYEVISGGAYNDESIKEIIYSKRNIIQIKNKGNSCFWWCIILLMYQHTDLYKKLKDLRYTSRLDQLAKQLCLSCGYDYAKQINSDDIPNIIEHICSVMKESMFNIIILDMNNLPSFSTTTQITSNIMFQTNFKTNKYFYLLYDNHHYSPILDIKQFLNVRGFVINVSMPLLIQKVLKTMYARILKKQNLENLKVVFSKRIEKECYALHSTKNSKTKEIKEI